MEFVEEEVKASLANPLEKVIASTFLGGDDFIRRVRKEYLEGRKIDKRNIPSVRKVLRGPTPGEIEAEVAKVTGEDTALYRKLCIHLSHQWSGWSLEEVGTHFGMKSAAVSQMSRRFRKMFEVDKNMGKLIERIKKKLLIVET